MINRRHGQPFGRQADAIRARHTEGIPKGHRRGKPSHADAAIVATDVATATMTAPADIAAYAEIFTALEQAASFGDEARDHLARIAADYRQLSA